MYQFNFEKLSRVYKQLHMNLIDYTRNGRSLACQQDTGLLKTYHMHYSLYQI